MEKLEKVELIREKTGVSYEDAKAALDACDDDVLDALVWLEREGKVAPRTASYSTGAAGQVPPVPSAEMVQAQVAYERSSEKSKFGKAWESFCAEAKRLWDKSLAITFVAERGGERVVTLPVLVPILGLLFWGATIWLLIIGLFFGFRYHLEGARPVTVDVNGAMDWAAEKADAIKSEFVKDERPSEA